MRPVSVFAAVIAAALIALAVPAQAQTTLTLSSWLPPSHATTRALVDWAKEVEKASNGRIRHTLLAKGVSAPAGTYDAVRDGLADVSWNLEGYTPGRFFLTRVVEFPFLGETSEITSVAYWRIHERYLAKAQEHKGLRVIGVFTHGPGGIFTTKKPIRSVADFQGMKFRIGGGMITDLAAQLGINVLLKPASESFEILTTGIADGSLSSTEGIAAFKLDKVIRYYTRVPGGLYNTSFAVVMNPAAYERLSAQDKAVIDASSGEKLSRLFGKYWTESDAVGIQAMKTSNVEFIDANEAFVGAIRAQLKGLEASWFEAAKSRGVDGPRVLQDLRDEIRKVSAGR